MSQIRVAAIILSGDLLLIHRSIEDDFWALPGGKLEPGETTTEAIAREIYEELDLEVERLSLAGIIETRFDYQGSEVQQIGFYFSVELNLVPTEPFTRLDGAAELEFRWVPIDQLHEVDLRPKAIIELLGSSHDHFCHLATPRRLSARHHPVVRL